VHVRRVDLCQYVLTSTSSTTLVKSTLNCLLKFLTWIPLQFVFGTPLIDVSHNAATRSIRFFTFVADVVGEIPTGARVAQRRNEMSHRNRLFGKWYALFFALPSSLLLYSVAAPPHPDEVPLDKIRQLYISFMQIVGAQFADIGISVRLCVLLLFPWHNRCEQTSQQRIITATITIRNSFKYFFAYDFFVCSSLMTDVRRRWWRQRTLRYFWRRCFECTARAWRTPTRCLCSSKAIRIRHSSSPYLFYFSHCDRVFVVI
jgi:hypothetical protein